MAAYVNEQALPTVLLVDDEPKVITVLRRVLTGAGFNVLATTDPTKALGIMSATRVDILISDLAMPVMSGIELVSATREKHPDIVRIVLTGCSSIGATESLINDGEVHRFLTKPVSAADLRSTVQQALARKEELRRSTEAGRASSRRERLMAELEREHPGITHIQLDTHGVYHLDLTRLAQLEDRLESAGMGDLGRLLPRSS